MVIIYHLLIIVSFVVQFRYQPACMCSYVAFYVPVSIVGSGFGQKFRDMTRKKKSTGITGTRPGDPLRPIPVGSGSLMALLAPQTRSPGMWVPLHHHGSQAARPPEFFGTGPSGRPSRMTHGPARPPNYIQRVVPWVVLAVGWPW